MGKIRGILYSNANDERRGILEVSSFSLLLEGRQGEVRTRLEIVSEDRITSTSLTLGGSSLRLDLLDFSNENRTVLSFARFFNINFEEGYLWRMLASDTEYQIHPSHLEILKNYLHLNDWYAFYNRNNTSAIDCWRDVVDFLGGLTISDSLLSLLDKKVDRTLFDSTISDINSRISTLSLPHSSLTGRNNAKQHNFNSIFYNDEIPLSLADLIQLKKVGNETYIYTPYSFVSARSIVSGTLGASEGGTGQGGTDDISLSSLSDVLLTSPSNGDILMYEDGFWKNSPYTPGSGSGINSVKGSFVSSVSTIINDSSAFTLSGTLVNGVLTYKLSLNNPFFIPTSVWKSKIDTVVGFFQNGENIANPFITRTDADTYYAPLTSFTELSTIVSGNTTSITTLSNQITTKFSSLDTEIADIKTALDSKASVDSVSALRTYVDSTFVSLTKDEEIDGLKTFLKTSTFSAGIKIGNCTITYDAFNSKLKFSTGLYSLGQIASGDAPTNDTELSAGISREEVEAMLEGYATEDFITTKLRDYATSSALSSLSGAVANHETRISNLESGGGGGENPPVVSGITLEELNDILKDYVLSSVLESTLEDYAKTSALDNYYLKKVGVAINEYEIRFGKDTTIPIKYQDGRIFIDGSLVVTGSVSSGDAPGADADLSSGINEEELAEYLNNHHYATQSWVGSYVTGALSAYAKSNDIQNWVNTNFYTQTQVNSKFTEYDTALKKFISDNYYAIKTGISISENTVTFGTGESSISLQWTEQGLKVSGNMYVLGSLSSGVLPESDAEISGGGLDIDQLESYLTQNSYLKSSSLSNYLSNYATKSYVDTAVNNILDPIVQRLSSI